MDSLVFDSQPVTIARDRSLLVPPGRYVVTAWVEIDECVLGCRERIAVGDVSTKWHEILQRDGKAAWPPPIGEWKDGRFVILDGRHEYIATLMHGHERIFVAWLSDE